jgi:type II secretory pathway component PulF
MKGDKPTSARPSAPLVHPALAFLTAGACSAAAGYLSTTAERFRAAFETMGVELPWITQVVMDNTIALPIALLLISAAILGLAGRPIARSELTDALRKALQAAAVLVGVAAGGLVWANVLAFETLQRALQY